MKTLQIVAALLAAGAAVAPGLLAAGAAPARGSATSAVGEGSMSFGHDGDGRAYLRFDVEAGADPSGTLLFAAEDHHERFPDVLVELGSIDEARFGDRDVKFSGRGHLHDDPVSVTVSAFDEVESASPDRFVITCTDASGAVIFEADGELFRGDIHVDSREGGRP